MRDDSTAMEIDNGSVSAPVAKGGDGTSSTAHSGSELLTHTKEGLVTQAVAQGAAAPVVAVSSTAVSTMRGSTPPVDLKPNGVVDDSAAAVEASTASAKVEHAPDTAFETPRASHTRQSPPMSGPSEEAAALLLNFSTVGDHVPLPSIAENATYPHTPPQDSPTAPPRTTAAPIPPLAASSPNGPPALAAAARETSTAKPKQKRKRTANAVAGPSRQSSADSGRPTHSMGEDNTLIRCICGFTEDDGFTIQCEGCYAWEHGQCFGYPDEDSVPDIYYCELCHPRPVDTSAARLVQLQSRATWETRRLARVNEVVAMEQAKKTRGKPKRPRTDSGKENEPQEENQDPAATPSGTKPRRKQQSGKPRSRASEGGTYPPKDSEQDNEDYFRSSPWELEYTPLKDNVIRGVAARRAVSQLYREWIDGEDSPPRKRQPPTYHDSGLPSPTDTGIIRLSPDNLLSPPDFAILAPPVPPVFLSASDHPAPTSIRPVDDSACFLPLKYSEPNTGIYARPTIYGVFTQDAASEGTYFGEYRCEVLDTATYRKDAINQYSALGIPKPYVHSVGPPVNLMLDARSYGNELRFVRSGCHPNAVIRPVFYRSDNAKPAKLIFGIFASREIGKNEEVVLAWEWDDQHVVHTLRAIIDSTLKNAAAKPINIPPQTVEYLTSKFDSILTNVLGTFQSCACLVNTDCAFAQMRRLVNGQTFHGVSGARARKRIDLGELVGAVRGWRRRELEAEAASAKARRFRTSGEWDTWRAGPISAAGDDINTQPSRPQSEGASPRSQEGEDEGKVEGGDDSMEVEQPSPVPEEKTARAPSPPDEEREDAMDVDVKEDEVDDLKLDEVPSTPTAPNAPMPSSSVLSSLPSERAVPHDEEGEEEVSSGHESDATTITVARSAMSDESDEEEHQPDSDAAEEVRPAAIRRGRRVESPVAQPKRVAAKASTPIKDGKRRARKNVIASSDEEATSDDEEPPTPKAKRPRPVGLKASKARRRAAPKSESEADTPSRPRQASVGRKQKRAKVEKVEKAASKSREASPPAMEVSAPKEPTPEPQQASSPPKMPTPPPREPTPPPKAPTPPPKEPSPPPKEPTPPPKEPTPPPPKKVSMKEYLATHKIRKVSNPVPSPTADEKPGTPVETASTEASSDSSTPAPSMPAAAVATPGEGVSPTQTSQPPQPPRLNLMEHLPSSRAASVTPLATPFTPTTPAAAGPLSSTPSYVPRTDYFGTQPSATPSTAAYVPRQSASYVPRQSQDDPQVVTPTTPATPAYVPRQPESQLPLVSPSSARPSLPLQTPPRPSSALPEVPPALSVRDGPPHYAHSRPPPTGPRIPPTGPRGGWSGPTGQAPVSPHAPMRGGFPPRGGFGRGGYERGFGFRGRGLRGRGRGI